MGEYLPHINMKNSNKHSKIIKLTEGNHMGKTLVMNFLNEEGKKTSIRVSNAKEGYY